jgi:hypothetical protein
MLNIQQVKVQRPPLDGCPYTENQNGAAEPLSEAEATGNSNGENNCPDEDSYNRAVLQIKLFLNLSLTKSIKPHDLIRHQKSYR